MSMKLAVKQFTKEQLINMLQQYYDKYRSIPTLRGMKSKSEYYPNSHVFYDYFGSFKNALDESGLLSLRTDQYQFDRREYTDEELILFLKDYYKKHNSVPTAEGINSDKEFPRVITYFRRFGSFNKALELANLQVNHEPKQRTDEELISDLKQLYAQLGRTPTSRDIVSTRHMASESVYISRFGSLYSAFELGNIPYYRRSKFYSDEEIIAYWYGYKNELGRIPSLTELNAIDDKGISFSICYRWGNYYDFIKYLGHTEEYKKYGCRIYETTNGTKCLSYYELIITQFFEDNNLNFQKEVMYSEVIEDDLTRRRFDWVVDKNETKYFIEMFGIKNYSNYDAKRNNKIETCNKYNINLIEVYPEDLQKPLEEVFSFLFEKQLEVNK